MSGWIETMRVVKGEIPFLDIHAWRLRRGIFQSGKQITEEESKNILLSQVHSLPKNKNFRLRTVVENSNNNWRATSTFSEWKEEIFTARHEGYKLQIFKYSSKIYSEYFNQKTTERSLYDTAFSWAQQQGFDDALILNSEGNIADTCLFNSWVFKNNTLYTPPDHASPVRGVFKEFLLRNAPFTIIEKELSIEEILSAETVLLSNALRGMQWAQQIDNKRFEKHEIVDTINEWANDYLKLIK